MKCTHSDCFTCPYPDCIYTDNKNEPKPKQTFNRSEYWARYYAANKETIKKKVMARYNANKEKYSLARKKRYQERKKLKKDI